MAKSKAVVLDELLGGIEIVWAGIIFLMLSPVLIPMALIGFCLNRIFKYQRVEVKR